MPPRRSEADTWPIKRGGKSGATAGGGEALANRAIDAAVMTPYQQATDTMPSTGGANREFVEAEDASQGLPRPTNEGGFSPTRSTNSPTSRRNNKRQPRARYLNVNPHPPMRQCRVLGIHASTQRIGEIRLPHARSRSVRRGNNGRRRRQGQPRKPCFLSHLWRARRGRAHLPPKEQYNIVRASNMA